MNLALNEITRAIATQALELGIDVEKINGIDIFAMVETLKHQSFTSKKQADQCIRRFLKKEFEDRMVKHDRR